MNEKHPISHNIKDNRTAKHPQTCTIMNWRPFIQPRQFHGLFTLYSEYFSTFPHGTCLLSVSQRYLALEGDHLPYSAWTLDQTYSRKTSRTRRLSVTNGDFTHSVSSFQKELDRNHTLRALPYPTTPTMINHSGIQDGLFPFLSPILRESLLISFPPLNYMLKLSG